MRRVSTGAAQTCLLLRRLSSRARSVGAGLKREGADVSACAQRVTASHHSLRDTGHTGRYREGARRSLWARGAAACTGPEAKRPPGASEGQHCGFRANTPGRSRRSPGRTDPRREYQAVCVLCSADELQILNLRRHAWPASPPPASFQGCTCSALPAPPCQLPPKEASVRLQAISPEPPRAAALKAASPLGSVCLLSQDVGPGTSCAACPSVQRSSTW